MAQAVAVATYDGKRTRAGLRHDKHSRSIYPNGDVYWGEYRETYRTGKGFYLFKGGTSFAGTLAEGSFDVGTLRYTPTQLLWIRARGAEESFMTYTKRESSRAFWEPARVFTGPVQCSITMEEP